MFKNALKNRIFSIPLTLLLAFSLWIYADTKRVYHLIGRLSLWVRDAFGDFYLYLGLAVVLFMLGIALSPLGKKRLGVVEKPEYGFWAWFAMLYSAGMGSGILLRAVQEPVYMAQHPPLRTPTASGVMALEYTFYQWGFTPWAFYGLFALIVGFYCYRRRRGVLLSATLVGRNPAVRLQIVDVLTILTTVFGLVAALGLGATQITDGLRFLSPDSGFGLQTAIFLTLLMVAMAALSAWRGLDKGIKVLSKLNIGLTLWLLTLVFFMGSPVKTVLLAFSQSLYRYVLDFFPMSIAHGRYNPGKEFLTDWTYYYWAFWIAWAPFTGVFIARISKGRSLRQLILGVLLIPSLGTFFWFSTFGQNAFALLQKGGDPSRFSHVFSSIFLFYKAFPLTGLLCGVTLVLLIGFLVTSVDSAIFVLSMLSDAGRENPGLAYRLLWSLLLALFGVAVLLLGAVQPDVNVLVAVQKMLIVTSLPFSVLMIGMSARFLRDLALDKEN